MDQYNHIGMNAPPMTRNL